MGEEAMMYAKTAILGCEGCEKKIKINVGFKERIFWDLLV